MRTCLVLWCAALLPAQDKELKAIFERFDANKDGIVLRAEFPGSDEQFAAIDRNKDKHLDLAEFTGSAVAARLLEAVKANAAPPRDRLDPSTDYEKRLAGLMRLDKNKDRRIAREEWTGAPGAFTELDLVADGFLDDADRQEAKRRLEQKAAKDGVLLTLPQELKSTLPPPAELMKRLDENQDLRISRAEAGTSKLALVFDTADTNHDGFVDERELATIVAAVAEHLRRRDRGAERPRAFAVPFDAWDKNHDERLEASEFLERKELFPRIDADRNGFVTREEVSRYARSVENEGFLERFDLDGDGKVTFEEFGGPLEVWRRLDRNGDGVITAADR